ncbi:MAG: 50S ribosomal protein L18, partial [Candidatus Thioglobus sp.]|nr:50S ribosomal protein L18 [Candidatus Thioglobus sp.]
MKLSKKQARLRRATKFRAQHAERSTERLCVHKTSVHIYAQIISSCGTKTLASASTITSKVKNGGNVDAATKIGAEIA